MLPRLCPLAAAVALMSGCATRALPTPAPPEAFAAFPAGPGRELAIRVCSDCHSASVVARQQLDPAGWRSVVDQMAGLGAVATEAELEAIVLYLADAFPASE